MAALGIVETRGYTASVEALDTMCKTAGVKIKTWERPGGGHMTILAVGDVAAVNVAVEAGARAVRQLEGTLIYQKVIPNPHPGLKRFL